MNTDTVVLSNQSGQSDWLKDVVEVTQLPSRGEVGPTQKFRSAGQAGYRPCFGTLNMAMFDDRAFLIAHIRNSFITSDDTGMCELVLENDEGMSAAGIERDRQLSFCERRPSSWPYQSSKDAENAKVNSSMVPVDPDAELSHSCDIVPDMDFGGHRRRSDTAQRLDKLKRDKQKNSQIKRVHWKNVKVSGDNADLFPVKAVVRDTAPCPDVKQKRSVLSLQLEEFDSVPNNPFMEYAKYDGRASGGVAVKKIDIYLTMAPPRERPYPMTVLVLSSATVFNLIGLICWQYATESRQPSLNENVENYSLYMVEDDGEVDMDFPPLEKREPISKFGFAKLALVENPNKTSAAPKAMYTVNVRIPNEKTTMSVTFDNDSFTVKDILDRVLKSKTTPNLSNIVYRLEKESHPGETLDPETSVSALISSELVLIRENSAREAIDGEMDPLSAEISSMAQSLYSLQYESYIISMIHKLRSNTQVRFSVSGEKIEVCPVSSDSKFLSGSLLKLKPVVYALDDVISCTVVEFKPPDKAIFRLTYRHHQISSKHRHFEADVETAKNIVTKVTNIIDLRLNYALRGNTTNSSKTLKEKQTRRHTLRL